MNCKKCGSRMPDDVNFCPYCGEKMDPDNVEPEETSKDDIAADAVVETVDSSSILHFLPAIALVLLVAVGAFFFVRTVKPDIFKGISKPAQKEQAAETENKEETAVEPKAEFPKKMYVNSEDGLILRSGPGTDNDVVHLLSYGQEIEVEKIENEWAYTTVEGHTGWCSAEYLTEKKEEIKEKEKTTATGSDTSKLVDPTNNAEGGYHGYVDSPDGVNMRYGPGEEYEIIEVLPDRTTVVEQGWDEGWVYIECNGKYGWIKSEYFGAQGGKAKPVIYLYPTRTMDVNVKVKLRDDEFTESIPAGDGDWSVTANPNGRLTDKASGKSYDYIYWESTDNTEYDWSEGYVVAGRETEDFLQTVLTKMGLNDKEKNDFIEYWKPRMEKNSFNLVSFQTKCYTDAVKMDICPKPDSVLRIFMAFKEVQGPVAVSAPKIKPFERKGFAVVEWGGTERD